MDFFWFRFLHQMYIFTPGFHVNFFKYLKHYLLFSPRQTPFIPRHA